MAQGTQAGTPLHISQHACCTLHAHVWLHTHVLCKGWPAALRTVGFVYPLTLSGSTASKPLSLHISMRLRMMARTLSEEMSSPGDGRVEKRIIRNGAALYCSCKLQPWGREAGGARVRFLLMVTTWL